MRGAARNSSPATLVEVAPGVLVATRGMRTNSTVVLDGSGGCLVVDPGLSVSEIDATATELAALGCQAKLGFATHWHWDHVLWSAGLGEVPRYATAATVAHARARLAANAAQAEAAGFGVDLSASGSLVGVVGGELPWDGPRAVVLAHDAHARGHAALWLPELGVLIAGDMVSDVEFPLLDLEAPSPVGDYRRGMELLGTVAAGVRLVIPGHGGVGDGADFRNRLRADRQYLADLTAGLPSRDPRVLDPTTWLRGEHERAREAMAAHRLGD